MFTYRLKNNKIKKKEKQISTLDGIAGVHIWKNPPAQPKLSLVYHTLTCLEHPATIKLIPVRLA